MWEAISLCRVSATIRLSEPQNGSVAERGGGRMQGSHTHTRSMQYPEQVWQGKIESPKETETDAIEVLKFLDRMEAKHGKKSVMYCRCVLSSFHTCESYFGNRASFAKNCLLEARFEACKC